MRLKKVKNADIKIKESSYIIDNPFEYKGRWNELFNNDNELEIEIGMGKGDFIIDKALRNPNINYIGIEKYDSVILRACEKLVDLDIPNLRLICIDAHKLEEVFDREVNLIYLNFSDPWPKKKHAKRRLSSNIFLGIYSKIVKGDIVIKQKTDNDLLYEYSKESYLEYGFEILEDNIDYGMNEENHSKTEYEKKFIELGKNINYLHVIKKQSL